MDTQAVVATTRRWIADVVIGLNLCPFARRVFQGERIKYVVSDAADASALHEDLLAELQALVATPIEQVETTLLIHPRALTEFFEYNHFLSVAGRLLKRLGLRGVVQIASFHPQYQFADAEPDAVENYTNRSPYPMLHLLRESSVTAVASDEAELLAIPARNVETLRRLGRGGIRQLLDGSPHGPSGDIARMA